MTKEANETLSPELALRGYNLTKLYDDTPTQVEIVKIGAFHDFIQEKAEKVCVSRFLFGCHHPIFMWRFARRNT